MYTSKSWSHALNFSYVYIWITFIRQEKNRQKTQQVSKTNIESISILIDFFSEFIWFFRCFGAKKKIIFDYYECRIMCHTRHSPFKKSKRERKKIWKIYQIIFVIEIKAHTFHSTSDPLIFSDVDFFSFFQSVLIELRTWPTSLQTISLSSETILMNHEQKSRQTEFPILIKKDLTFCE